MNKNFLFMGVLLVLGVVAVSGCTTQYATNTITIQNTAFYPTTLNVKPGTTVTWINKDNETQNIVSNNGVFDSGNLKTNQSYNYTFNQSGSYPFHSTINTNLTGTIIVSSTTNNSSNGNSSAVGY
jgi:plastocyanin